MLDSTLSTFFMDFLLFHFQNPPFLTKSNWVSELVELFDSVIELDSPFLLLDATTTYSLSELNVVDDSLNFLKLNCFPNNRVLFFLGFSCPITWLVDLLSTLTESLGFGTIFNESWDSVREWEVLFRISTKLTTTCINVHLEVYVRNNNFYPKIRR